MKIKKSYLFELHLTVDSLTTDQLPNFERVCQTLGGQAVLIQLPVGEHTQQPMFTMTKMAESLAEVLAFIDNLKPQFLAKNFAIIRTKFEIPATQADDFLQQNPTTNGYFEWHGKVDFVRLENLAKLEILAKSFHAHLSKNVLKNSLNQRFLTIRHSLENQQLFYRQVYDISEKISQHSEFSLLKSQQEYCVFDDKISLDKGWL